MMISLYYKLILSEIQQIPRHQKNSFGLSSVTIFLVVDESTITA